MNYKLTITIYNPEGKDSKNSKPYSMEFKCEYIHQKEGYGNKTYLSIDGIAPTFMDVCLDLRYDADYCEEKEMAFIADWAQSNWCGTDGAWKIKSMLIEELDK